MALRTMVSIFCTPDPEGDPFGVPDQIGTGSLIADALVLVHPPLSLEMAAGHRPENLNICAASWAGDAPEVDVVAVRAVDVGSWDPESGEAVLRLDPGVRRQPVVALRLDRATSVLRDPELNNLQDVLTLLADPFNGPATGDGQHSGNWWCINLGIGCP